MILETCIWGGNTKCWIGKCLSGREIGDIHHIWTFGLVPRPMRITLNTEEEMWNRNQWNLKIFHLRSERDVGDICQRWTFGHLDWSRPLVLVSSQETWRSSGQGDTWTVADSTSQSGRRKCKKGKNEGKEIEKIKMSKYPGNSTTGQPDLTEQWLNQWIQWCI